jgi:hypothetical protein
MRALGVKKRGLGHGEQLVGAARAGHGEIVEALERFLRIVFVKAGEIRLEKDVPGEGAELAGG